MSLLEEVLRAREEAEGKPPCRKCKHLFWIDKETPFCKKVDRGYWLLESKGIKKYQDIVDILKVIG